MADTDQESAVEAVFAPAGPLARRDGGFRPRDAQTRMAVAVAQALEERRALVVEAGTGTGKTFAYLVPTLLSGVRTLLSTATKSLQDQLFLRDIPTLKEALGVPATVALLKGRSSYLCVHRLAQARSTALLSDRTAVRTLARIETWAPSTTTGDFSEIQGLDERSSALPLVSSTRDNCLGSECPEFNRCHVVKARRAAMAADIVVVNHHLYFADLAVRESKMAELLPTVDAVIFDEAHQLVSVGVQFLGLQLGSAALLDFARDLTSAGLQHARGLASWQLLAAAVEQSARDLRLACAGGDFKGMNSRLRWSELARRPAFVAALAAVDAACGQALLALEQVAAAAPDFPRLAERAHELCDKAHALLAEAAPGKVRWVDVSAHHVRLTESPLDIRESLRAQRENSGKAWVFTSATLGDDAGLSWFVEPAGLEGAQVLRFPSPFDFARNARIYVPPRSFPAPNEPTHSQAVAAMATRFARALGGRTFVLTTTLRALRAVADEMIRRLRAEGVDLQVLVQGESPKRQLLQQFLAQPRSVLVGSHSFWEGIDVPGEALQCVVIDKLPFPPPGDALIEARGLQIKAQGRSPFDVLYVAEAAVAMKQGAGRLIRSETDCGLIAVADPRLKTMAYGARLLAAMPPATRVEDEDTAVAFLEGLRAAAAADHGA